MKNYRKIFLYGIVMLVVGALIFGGLVLYGFANPDIIRASDQKVRIKQGFYKEPIEKVIEVQEQTNAINITVPSNDVEIIGSDVEDIKITYCEDYQGETQYQVADGILNFKLANKIYINLDFLSWIYKDYSKTNTVIIEIPNELTCDYNINISSGNLNINNITAGELKAVLSSGNVSINDFSANNTNLRSSSGNIKLNNASIVNEVKLKVSSGNATLSNVNSKSLIATMSSGNTRISNCVTSSFTVSSQSGNIILERLQSQSITMKNSSGNIEINQLVYAFADYSYSMRTRSGYIKLNGSNKGNNYEHLDEGKAYSINALVSSGNIIITE